MAQGNGNIYNNFKEVIMNGVFNLTSDTLKMILVGTYTPNVDTHAIKADVGTEVVASGYTAGGVTLTSKAVTQDDTNNRGKFDAADVNWAALGTPTPALSHAILYDDTPTSPADPLICYWEVTTAPNGGSYTLQFGANGILLLS